WGLRPGSAAQPPPAVPGVPTPVVPAPVVPAPVIPTPAPPAPTVPVRQGPASPPPGAPASGAPAPGAPVPVVPAPTSPPPLVEPVSASPLPPTEAMQLPLTEAMPLPTEVVSQPPTEAMPLPTRAMPKVAPREDLEGVDQPTAAYTVQPWEPESTPMLTTPAFGASSPPPADPDVPAGGATGPTSAIDSLFADNKFEEYQELGVLQTISPPPTSVGPAAPVEHAPITTTQRTLMFVATGLIGVIALVALFFLGQRLAETSADQAIPPASTGAATPAAPQATVNGLAAPGVHPFAALQGGECLQPFTTAWAATYTVVDCAAGHSGQLVFKGKLPDAATAAYPTGAQFQTEITPLCSAPTVINYGIAKAVTDLQVSFSYPATAQAWNGGDRTYYCFVNRSGGGGLPGDLAVAK
ncbi:MAG: hypothetical protein QOI14_833, partial [Actinomycetota bacterium]|nr:hypothetical protein [Actinomycetota bacterium]